MFDGAETRNQFLVFEDAHWIDPTSRELLDRALERANGLPVLILITHRPDFNPPWIGQPNVTVMALSRLGRREGLAMVEQIAAGKAIPPELLEQIVARTDGVPLFVEELTKTVLESGALREEADRYVLAGEVAAIPMPATLQASLIARLDRLTAVKEVAQVAATIGREFSHALIEAVSALPSAVLHNGLEQLIEAGLVFRRGEPPEATYTFKHALVQDAAYGSLLKTRRQQLNQTIANALDTRFPDIVAAEPELLARHYTEAGLIERAVDRWEAAGHKALTRSAQHEAAAHFREALRLIRELPDNIDRNRQELKILLLLGRALVASVGAGSTEVRVAYVRTLELAREIGDVDAFVHAIHGLNSTYTMSGRFNETVALGAAAIEFAQIKENGALVAMADRIMGNAYHERGELIAAERHFSKSIAFFKRNILRELAGFVHNPLPATQSDSAVATWAIGRPDEALNTMSEALDAVD